MAIRLTKKQKHIFADFLKNDNKPISNPEIYSALVKRNVRISKRTVKNTLDDYDQFNKIGNPALLVKDLDKTTGGTCYKIKEDLDTFVELARGLLITKEFSPIFFQSKYAQKLLKNKSIISYIEENLNLEFLEDTKLKIHQIIQNSPSALYFGLFKKNLLSQKTEDIGFLPDEAEHEIRENFISRLLDDLRDKDFFLSENLEELGITVTMNWKFKEKKESKFNLKLKYKQ
ncbi:MAG: hypothetical protein JSW06_04250 [Thermoplasmatales archaeon]|nr:MAG: hypothetical protein JSW06_04250 [Thermoplasmatales archaeon]